MAAKLEAAASGRKPPARLFFLTDPERTSDPVAVAETLPAGAAVIYRSFGATDALEVGRGLRAATTRRGGLYLVGADETLAEAVGADGLHLPERMLAQGSELRARRPGWVLTGAAHSAAALAQADRAGLDAVLVSSVFPSGSPSAGAPLGVEGFAALLRTVRTPVIALGGVNRETAHLLVGSGAAGLAAVEAWSL